MGAIDHFEGSHANRAAGAMNEFDAGRVQELQDQLAAVERAEQRLRDGTFGISIQSGAPIPDARLEARPTAELTVEEASAHR